MVSINLLKGQRHDKRRGHRRSVSELLVGIVVLISVFLVWGWMAVDGSQAVQRLERAIHDRQTHLAVMQQHQDRILVFQEQRNTLLAEHQHLKALTTERERPIRLLSVISQVVDPLDIWLRRLQAKGARITLSGVALSHAGILALARDLENTDMLGPVSVFEIQAHVTQPALFRFSMNVAMDSADHG